MRGVLSILAILSSTVAIAQTSPTKPAISKIEQAIDELSQSYGDVPSSIYCNRPKNQAEILICRSPYLTLAELLSARSQAYGVENGTKREVNHRNFKARLPSRCSSETCILQFFAQQTNESNGAMSPYSQ